MFTISQPVRFHQGERKVHILTRNSHEEYAPDTGNIYKLIIFF